MTTSATTSDLNHPIETEQAAQGSTPRAKGRRRLLLVAAAAAVTLGSYFGYRELTSHQQSTDDAQVEADVVPLSLRVGGQVLAVHVADNALVKKGDVLVELDPSDLAARVKQAEGELEAAKAQADFADAQEQVLSAGARGGYSSANAQVSSAEAQVGSAAAQLTAASAQLASAEVKEKTAQTELARSKQLHEAGALTQEQLDQSQSEYDRAKASADAARAQVSAAQQAHRVSLSHVAEARGQLDTVAPISSKIASAHASAELAHARVTTAEAALELAKLNLSYATLRAPTDGEVSKLTARPGQLLSTGQPIAELVPTQSYVVANFKETQIAKMKPGQRVDVELDAFGGHQLHGTVQSISGGTGARFSLLPPDNASGNFVKVVQRVPVRIQWDSPPSGLNLLAGLSAVVTVHTQ